MKNMYFISFPHISNGQMLFKTLEKKVFKKSWQGKS